MRFFNGFCLRNEEHFFDAFTSKSEFSICGFSYGAVKALQETLKSLQEHKRVDRLQLFSPAFFQTKSEKFKRLQSISFNRSKEAYIEQFTASCFAPYPPKVIELAQCSSKELEELLWYTWDKTELETLVKSGVVIEVYLGSEDAIIDVNAAKEFFLDVATVTYIKGANHFLQIN